MKCMHQLGQNRLNAVDKQNNFSFFSSRLGIRSLWITACNGNYESIKYNISRYSFYCFISSDSSLCNDFHYWDLFEN